MTGSADASADGSSLGTEGPLEARLEVEPHEEAGCAVADFDDAVAEVTQGLKRCPENCGDDWIQCQAAITRETAEREFLTGSIDERCVCPAFDTTDCVPELETVRDGALVFSLTVPDRTELRRTIDELRDLGAEVSLQRITKFDENGEVSVELDETDVTSKQREAVEIAVAEGYYDDPRRTDLTELADRLDVSKSAVSQRLNTVEAKLVRSLVEELQ